RRPGGPAPAGDPAPQLPAPAPPPATPDRTAGKAPLGKQAAAPRRNPRPVPPRATASNSSAVSPRHDTTPTVTPPIIPPVAQNPSPALVPAAPPPPPPPPPTPPDPRPQIDVAIAGYARALEAQDINAVKRAAPGLRAQSVQTL